jgi:hypothetical protein
MQAECKKLNLCARTGITHGAECTCTRIPRIRVFNGGCPESSKSLPTVLSLTAYQLTAAREEALGMQACMKDARKGACFIWGDLMQDRGQLSMTLFCAPCCQVGHANGPRWASTTRFTAGG